MKKMDKIDIVITWVDGADVNFLKRHQDYFGDFEERKERYRDNGELIYLMRSIEKNFPECNHIYLVTDKQVPSWLNLKNKKISIVDHTEIIPKEYLPTFNSNVIETYTHRIKGLSEKYLVMNDDFLLTKRFDYNHWYTKDGFPIVRYYTIDFKKVLFHRAFESKFFPLTPYKLTIINCQRLVGNPYPRYVFTFPCHILTPCLKSDYKRIIEDIPKYAIHFRHTSEFKFRTPYDVQRYVVPLAAALEGRTQMLEVPYEEEGYYDVWIPSAKTLAKNPCICMNDTGNIRFGEILRLRMEQLFPDKCSFEKDE